jgi:murein tripeptide amidase MpaA
MNYLSAQGVESCLQYLADTYPAITSLHTLPEASVEGRTIRAIKIANGGGSRTGVLFLGGVHARELINPDLLVSFALDLCSAYSSGGGLTYGGKSYPHSTIQLVVEALEVWILPLVNPDGRVYVQTPAPAGDAWWRKNRRPTATCTGIDVNRNFDFLWSSGIGTSADPCDYQIYKGASAFSEPETRNVRSMLDAFPNIRVMVDVHSYSEDILYPWGDDDTQTTDSAMNFTNSAYDGLRGIPGDNVYREYMPPSDLTWYQSVANRASQAIQAVRGTVYTPKPGIGLYPTSGTSDDYSYSRAFAAASQPKIHGFTVETAKEFQPAYAEALNVIQEVSAGLIEFCIGSICVVEQLGSTGEVVIDVDDLRKFRDEELAGSAAGRRYMALLAAHSSDIAQMLASDAAIRQQAAEILRAMAAAIASRRAPEPPKLSASLASEVSLLVDALEALELGDERSLRGALADLRRDVHHFAGRDILAGLAAADAEHLVTAE